MPKPPTAWEVAKPILEKDYLEGRITDTMKRSQVHKMRPEYEKVNINNFGNNQNRLKKTIREFKSNATRDAQLTNVQGLGFRSVPLGYQLAVDPKGYHNMSLGMRRTWTRTF